jgi:hypothetical protein
MWNQITRVPLCLAFCPEDDILKVQPCYSGGPHFLPFKITVYVDHVLVTTYPSRRLFPLFDH